VPRIVDVFHAECGNTSEFSVYSREILFYFYLFIFVLTLITLLYKALQVLYGYVEFYFRCLEY